MSAQLKVRLVKSLIGEPEKLRVVARGLGLRRPGSEVTVAKLSAVYLAPVEEEKVTTP